MFFSRIIKLTFLTVKKYLKYFCGFSLRIAKIQKLPLQNVLPHFTVTTTISLNVSKHSIIIIKRLTLNFISSRLHKFRSGRNYKGNSQSSLSSFYCWLWSRLHKRHNHKFNFSYLHHHRPWFMLFRAQQFVLYIVLRGDFLVQITEFSAAAFADNSDSNNIIVGGLQCEMQF